MLIKAYLKKEELIKIAIAKGLTSKAIYDGAGISNVTFWKLSKGMGVRIDVAKKITDFLGLKAEDIFTIEVKKSKNEK